MNDLPAGVIRLPAPPELMLGEQHHHHNYDWHRSGYQLDFLTDAETAKAFPEPVPVDAPETLQNTERAPVASAALPRAKPRCYDQTDTIGTRLS